MTDVLAQDEEKLDCYQDYLLGEDSFVWIAAGSISMRVERTDDDIDVQFYLNGYEEDGMLDGMTINVAAAEAWGHRDAD